MQLVNSALFLNAKNLFLKSENPLWFAFVRMISPFTTKYASHKSGLSINVLNLICLLGLYLSSASPD